MSYMTGNFKGQAARRTVAFIFSPEHAEIDENWGPQKPTISNLEVLDPAGIEKIQQMTDPKGNDVLVLSIADKDKEPHHFVFKNFSSITTAIGLTTDIVEKVDHSSGNANYGGVIEVSANDLEGYTAVPDKTVVDADLVAFTRDVASEMRSRYQPRSFVQHDQKSTF
ncbi:MAG: hypothetical protein AAF988_08735 [Pseudomonadota bacterium]